MNAAVKFKVTRSVNEDTVFGDPVRRMFDRIMLLAHSKAVQPGQVPIDTGYLRQTLAPGGGVTEVGGNWEDGFYAQVGTNLDYGSILENSESHHYRGGPSAGQMTQGWLSRIEPAVIAEIPAIAQQCAREMEAGWKK